MEKGSKDPSQNQPGPASGLDLAGSSGSSLPFHVEEFILRDYTGSEDPSQNQPGPASGLDLAGSSGSSLPFPVEEFILNLSEEEWKGFSDTLETPMTRSQFVKLSKTVLKMVNLSSFGMVLPTFVRGRYEPESVSDTSSSKSGSGRSSSSSSETSAASSPETGSSSSSSSEGASGLSSSSRFATGSASASSSTTAGGPMLRMKGALAAFRKKVTWRSPCHSPVVTAVHSSMSNIHADSDERSAIFHSRFEAMTRPLRGSESRDVDGFEILLDRLFSNESIDHIAQALVGQVQGVMQDGGPSGAPVAAAVPEAVYTNTEGAIRNLLQPYFTPLVVYNSPEHVASQKTPIDGSLKKDKTVPDMARLAELLLAELENAHSAAVLGAEDNVRASTSHSVGQSCQSRTSSLKTNAAEQESPRQNRRQRIFGLFSKLMVHRVMDKMHEDSAAQQEQENVRMPSTAASLLLGDRKDHGCFVTVLLLRLLARMSDGCTCCGAKRLDQDVLQKLIEDLLIEFTSDPGCPSFDGYLNNPKIQTIYRAMDAFLLKEFGSEAILKRATNTQDDSFDATLLAQLRKELLTQGNVQDPAAPSTQSDLPSFSPVPDVTSGKTVKKVRSKLKIFKIRSSAKISPTYDASDMGLESETTVIPAAALSDDGIATAHSDDRKEPRKRPWYKIFSRLSCFGGPAEI